MKLGLLALLVISACGTVRDDRVDGGTDPCANGACNCTVATQDTDCGAHQICDTTGGGRFCACVDGYTDGVNGCVWTGSVQDPGFASASAWTPAGGALLNPTAPGSVDPGEASYVSSAVCGLGTVTQTIQMPTFARAEQLVLELSYKDQRDQQTGDTAFMGISLGAGWSALPFFSDGAYHTARLCLGEAGYAPAGTDGKGAGVKLTLGPYNKGVRCPSSNINFGIDHAAIVTANAGECGPMPGLGPNADAEGTTGWTFTMSGSGFAGFASGLGVGGSRAARLINSQRCDQTAMSTTISVPLTPHPAIDFFLGTNGTAGLTGTITINGLATMSMPTALSTTVHACLPPSMRGQAATLAFALRNGMGGSCVDQVNNQMWVDNVKVVEDPTCETTDNLADPGFEQGGSVFGGFSTAYIAQPDGQTTIRNATGAAHGGTHYLEIDSFVRCETQGVTLFPTVPPPAGASGPALTFFADVASNPDAVTTVNTIGTPVTLTKGGGYLPYTVCLDPLLVGRPQPVTVSMYGGNGTCMATGLTETTRLDDLAVTTSAMCPAP